MNGDPESDQPSEPPEASAEPSQAKDDVPAVKMESDPEWMDGRVFRKADPEWSRSYREKRGITPEKHAEFVESEEE